MSFKKGWMDGLNKDRCCTTHLTRNILISIFFAKLFSTICYPCKRHTYTCSTAEELLLNIEICNSDLKSFYKLYALMKQGCNSHSRLYFPGQLFFVWPALFFLWTISIFLNGEFNRMLTYLTIELWWTTENKLVCVLLCLKWITEEACPLFSFGICRVMCKNSKTKDQKNKTWLCYLWLIFLRISLQVVVCLHLERNLVCVLTTSWKVTTCDWKVHRLTLLNVKLAA